MSDQTPLEQAREQWLTTIATEQREAAKQAFDTWLAELQLDAYNNGFRHGEHSPRVIQPAKADAWEEGYAAACDDQEADNGVISACPYYERTRTLETRQDQSAR